MLTEAEHRFVEAAADVRRDIANAVQDAKVCRVRPGAPFFTEIAKQHGIPEETLGRLWKPDPRMTLRDLALETILVGLTEGKK